MVHKVSLEGVTGTLNVGGVFREEGEEEERERGG